MHNENFERQFYRKSYAAPTPPLVGVTYRIEFVGRPQNSPYMKYRGIGAGYEIGVGEKSYAAPNQNGADYDQNRLHEYRGACASGVG